MIHFQAHVKSSTPHASEWQYARRPCYVVVDGLTCGGSGRRGPGGDPNARALTRPGPGTTLEGRGQASSKMAAVALVDAFSLFDDLAPQPPARGEDFDAEPSAVAIEVEVGGSGLVLTGDGGCHAASPNRHQVDVGGVN